MSAMLDLQLSSQSCPTMREYLPTVPQPHSDGAQGANILRALMRRDPEARRLFDLARANRRRVDSAYDISVTCNMRCEGCLFFDRAGGHGGAPHMADLAQFRALFAEEKARGITYPLFAGAETALRQDILMAAAELWDCGMVHTNATIPMRAEIPFRLYVSMWGHRANTAKWRAAGCYDKVMRNIEGDLRVVVNYTISRANIDDIAPVAADCAARGVRMTFQVYSPTTDYLDFLAEDRRERHPFLHDSAGEDNLILRPEDDRRACDAVKRALDAYPETILFSHDLADFVFAKPGIFWGEMIGDAVPVRCTAAHDAKHRHYQSDLSLESRKTCGHANIDCRRCRTYTTIYPGYFQDRLKKIANEADAYEYLRVHATYHSLFYID